MMTREAFIDFVKEAGIAALGTVNVAGRPEVALVELAVTDDGHLIFQSKTNARKVANLFKQARVALMIGRGDQDGVSLQVEGVADLLMGAKVEEAAATYAAQHPGRPPMSPAFVLYSVNPEWVRVCKAGPAGPPQIVEGALL